MPNIWTWQSTSTTANDITDIDQSQWHLENCAVWRSSCFPPVMIFARLCPSLPCAQRKTAPYFQIHLNVEPSERCSIDSIAPYPPKKNKLEQSLTTTSDSSEILLVDFLGVYDLAILQSPQPTNRLQRTKAASVCCHAGSTWGMRGTCTLHRWTDQMKDIYLWLYLRFDGDMMGIWWGMEISWFLFEDLMTNIGITYIG